MKPSFLILFLGICICHSYAQRFTGTMTVGGYTRENVVVKLKTTSAQDVCAITMFNVKFARMMPVTLDVTINPVTKKNGLLTGDNIIPSGNGKRYEKYVVRQLKGNVGSDNLRFSCTMGDKKVTYSGRKE